MVRTGRNSEMTRARKKPTTLPPKKPIMTSRKVTTRSFKKVPSARFAHRDFQTSRGLGKMAGETSNFLVYHCQKQTRRIALRSQAAKRAAFLYARRLMQTLLLRQSASFARPARRKLP